MSVTAGVVASLRSSPIELGHASTVLLLWFFVTILCVAALGKVLAFSMFRAELNAEYFPSRTAATLAAAAIIIVEALCAALLVGNPSSWTTRVLASSLFIAFFLRSLLDGRRSATESCRCFGTLLPPMRRGTAASVRNGFLLLLWLLVLVGGSPTSRLGTLGVAASIGCVVALVVGGLIRPRRGMEQVRPLAVGATIPTEIRALLDSTVNGRGVANTVLFTRSDCSVCHETERSLNGLGTRQGIADRLVVVTDDETPWQGWRYRQVANKEVTRLAHSLGCDGVPCALRIDRKSVV